MPTRILHTLRTDRVLTLASLAALAYVAAYLTASLVIPTGTRANQILVDLVYALPALVATPLTICVAWRSTRDRSFWWLVAASVSAGFAGDVCWAVYDLVIGSAPTPSLADAFYLAGVALIIPAIIVKYPPSRHRWRELVDMLMPLAAVAYWVYEFALAPQLRNGINGAVAASVGECGIAVVAALLFTGALAGYRDVPGSVKLVFASTVAQGISYPIYAYGVSVQGWAAVTWIYTGWQVSGVLVILAALAALRTPQRVSRHAAVESDVNVWLTTAGLGLVMGIVALKTHDGRLDTVALDIGLVMVAAVVVRVHEVMRQRGRLAAELHRALETQARLATTDPLTDIPNRRVFDDTLRAFIEQRGGGQPPLGLAILDLDHFKRVNDGYGHPAGDELLRQVAHRLRAAVRSTDTVARIGGEEFAIVSRATTAESLAALAERCREAIGAISFQVAGNPIAVTASVGVARYPADARDSTELVQAADRALYAAKAAGRDRMFAAGAAQVRTLPTPQTPALAYLEALADQLDREQSEQSHSAAMLVLASQLCDALGLTTAQRRRCLVAARLHDVGKVGVPDHILTKPGPLTPEEWEVMRDHVRLGVELLRRAPETADVAAIVADHHERVDGRGYPAQKVGAEIAIEARIIAVVDAWTAMAADRPYRPALSASAALAQLHAGRGSQFDGAVVDALLGVLARNEVVARAA
jgi:two-component system, cell cycle response regulator